MKHLILSIRPATGGLRRYAVTSAESVITASDWSGEMYQQSDQTWDLHVWRRIEDRGYVARLTGGGQWGNRGDHSVYVGTGATAEAAAIAAWSATFDDTDYESGYPIPRSLVAAARDHDAEVTVPSIE